MALLTTVARAATIVELKGTVIGSPKASYSSGGPEVVFDGNPATFYGSDARSNTWVGLDLGTKHVITRVAYASRKDWPQRMQLGIFEGANNPDFTDAVPLYLIKNAPNDNVMTYAAVRVSRGFRYVRYVGPNDVRCNVAELKFYGYEGEGSDSRFYTPTNLPLLTIHTDGAATIDSKEVYRRAIINVISDGGKTIYTDSLGIRGRGNASWDFPKKPYRLKLDNKTHLLGMPANAKKWTLINNYGDKTLMRNAVAFEISRRLDMDYTPACTMVDVMVNGEYQGTYQLCDQIEVKKHRVGIVEMTPEDNTLPALGGGYLVEIDAYASAEPSTFTTSAFSLPVTIKSPDSDDITRTQYNYLRNIFGRMVSSVSSGNYASPTLGYVRYLDPESFLKHFLVGELSGNTDTYWSVYMYKDRDSTRFRTGPVWDFDLAFENDARTHPISGISTYLYASGKSSCAGNMRGFVTRVVNSQRSLLSRIWSNARYNRGLDIDGLNAVIDSLQAELNESQRLNFIRWPIMNQLVHQEYQCAGSFEAEVKVVRDFLEWRIPWLDNHIGLVSGIEDAHMAASGNIGVTAGGISVSGFAAKTAVNVYDTGGMLIARLTVASSGNAEEISLAPGVYVVKADAPDGSVVRKKVVVQR